MEEAKSTNPEATRFPSRPRVSEEGALAIARASLAASGFIPPQIANQLGADVVARLQAELGEGAAPAAPSANPDQEG